MGLLLFVQKIAIVVSLTLRMLLIAFSVILSFVLENFDLALSLSILLFGRLLNVLCTFNVVLCLLGRNIIASTQKSKTLLPVEKCATKKKKMVFYKKIRIFWHFDRAFGS